MKQAIFLQGSIFRHLWRNTISTALGLAMLNLGDFIILIFLTYANSSHTIAALGYDAVIVLTMKAIRFSIVMTLPVIIGKRIGAKDWTSVSNAIYSLFFTCFFIGSLTIILFLPPLHFILQSLGATGDTFKQAYIFALLIIISTPMFFAARSFQRLLQVFGNAKDYAITNSGSGILTITFSYFSIIIFHWGIVGAAVSLILSRFLLFLWVIIILYKKHPQEYSLTIKIYYKELKLFLKFFFPSLIAQCDLPIIAVITTYFISFYGTSAMATFAIITRIRPLIRMLNIGLSQSTIIIVAQNLGGQLFHRIKRVIWASGILMVINSLLIGLILSIFIHPIIIFLKVPVDGIPLFNFFIHFQVPLLFFTQFLIMTSILIITFEKPIINVLLNWLALIPLIPLTLAITPLMHETAILLVITLSNATFAVVALILLIYYFNKTKYQHTMMKTSDPLQEIIETSKFPR